MEESNKTGKGVYLSFWFWIRHVKHITNDIIYKSILMNDLVNLMAKKAIVRFVLD